MLTYCIERGNLPGYRIAVCGYEGDGYEALEAKGWDVVAWRSTRRLREPERRQRQPRPGADMVFSGMLSAANTLGRTGDPMTQLSTADAILHAAEGRTLTLEDLAVRLWESDRRRFGMAGYADLYPEPRKVACILMGQKGLVARGLLSQNGRLYSLTEAGAARLLGEKRPVEAPSDGPNTVGNGRTAPKAAPDGVDIELRRLLETGAWRYRDKSCRAQLTFSHALEFWGVEEAAWNRRRWRRFWRRWGRER